MTIIPVSRSSTRVYQTALAALHAGISCIPILADGTKSPAVKWKDYQKQRPTFHEAAHWFSRTPYGIAFITGEVSGGLEMLDFDSYPIYTRFAEIMQQEGLAGTPHTHRAWIPGTFAKGCAPLLSLPLFCATQ